MLTFAYFCLLLLVSAMVFLTFELFFIVFLIFAQVLLTFACLCWLLLASAMVFITFVIFCIIFLISQVSLSFPEYASLPHGISSKAINGSYTLIRRPR